MSMNMARITLRVLAMKPSLLQLEDQTSQIHSLITTPHVNWFNKIDVLPDMASMWYLTASQQSVSHRPFGDSEFALNGSISRFRVLALEDDPNVI
ncbi:hypothetical protein Tco_0527355 [Tanacetum coccineum]